MAVILVLLNLPSVDKAPPELHIAENGRNMSAEQTRLSQYRIRIPHHETNNHLPPLSALRAFEAAARLKSFSKAADELHVTPAAISHQIHALEADLGIRLFHRLNR